MNKSRTFVSFVAVGLAGLLGISCDYEPDDTVGYESPTEYEVDEPLTEPADPIGEPDFGEPVGEPRFDDPIEQEQEFNVDTTVETEERMNQETQPVPEGAEIPDINQEQSPVEQQQQEQQQFEDEIQQEFQTTPNQ